jgi:hypothetical protein
MPARQAEVTAGQLRDYLTRHCHEWGDDLDVFVGVPVPIPVPGGVGLIEAAGIVGSVRELDLRKEHAPDGRSLGMSLVMQAVTCVVGDRKIVDLRPSENEGDNEHGV